MLIAQQRQVPPPHAVLIRSDNCVRECKNQYFLLYLANLCARHLCRVSGLMNLRKAHSHSAIDQLCGIVARPIAACDTLYSPSSVIGTITEELKRPSLRAWIGLQSEIHVEKMDCVRSWKNQFATAQRVGLAGGLREDHSANHVYLMMLHRGAMSMLRCHVLRLSVSTR